MRRREFVSRLQGVPFIGAALFAWASRGEVAESAESVGDLIRELQKLPAETQVAVHDNGHATRVGLRLGAIDFIDGGGITDENVPAVFIESSGIRGSDSDRHNRDWLTGNTREVVEFWRWKDGRRRMESA